MKQRDGAPTQLAAMSREEFLNSISNFLDHLSDSLKGRDISFRAIGKEHGSQRWEHGFDLTMTIQEWGVILTHTFQN